MSNIGVIAIVEGCRHLTSITLSNCVGISSETLTTLRITYPHLTAFPQHE